MRLSLPITVGLLLSFTLAAEAQDRVPGSAISDAIDRVQARVSRVLDMDVDGPLKREAGEIVARLAALEDLLRSQRPTRWMALTVDVMDRFSGAAFDGKLPSTGPLATTVGVLDKLSWVAFNPQPDPPGRVGIVFLDHFAAGAFGRDDAPTESREQIAVAWSVFDRISAVTFNPQPDPPGRQMQVSSIGVLDQIAAVMFNPQPDPPGDGARAVGWGLFDKLSAVAFNPQPDPPGYQLRGLGAMGKIAEVLFNPQPEPPGDMPVATRESNGLGILDAIAAVAFNPQPDPPGDVGAAIAAIERASNVLLPINATTGAAARQTGALMIGAIELLGASVAAR